MYIECASCKHEEEDLSSKTCSNCGSTFSLSEIREAKERLELKMEMIRQFSANK